VASSTRWGYSPVGNCAIIVSATAAGFRIPYAAVYLVAIAQLVLAVRLLGEPDQALRPIDAYTTIWDVGLILFGVHLLMIGHLARRSGFMLKIFASCW